jgi:hypothetical protein
MPLTLDPQPAMAFECHEGNYGLCNILSAARTADASRVRAAAFLDALTVVGIR